MEYNLVTENAFEYKGYPCVVKFMPHGHRCGYVGISKFNPLYRNSPEYFRNKINCHGGVTYCEDHLPDGKDKDYLWVGFDCAHVCDGADYDLVIERYADDPVFAYAVHDAKILKDQHQEINFGPIRDMQYVSQECERIVDQLEKILSRKNDILASSKREK